MTDHESTPIIPENNTTPPKRVKVKTPTKNDNRPKAKQGAGLNKIKQDELVKWTVFVQPETKTASNRAAAKAGLTLTDWIDSRLREAATVELTTKPKPPAKPEDLAAEIVQRFAEQVKADQAAVFEQQNALIQRQGEQLAAAIETISNRPSTFREMLFGRAKPKPDKEQD